MVTSKHKKPLHILAEEAIKDMIAEPEYKNGKMLPNELDLAKNLGVSRNTLRQAINKLVFEGRLCRKKGVGTWVARKTVTMGVKNWLSFSQEMAKMGVKVKNYELHVSFDYVSGEIAEFFNIQPEDGCKCLKLQRVRGREELPFVVFDSYFNPKYDIAADDNFSMPLYELLEKKYGIVVHTSVEELSARLAGKRIADKLGISENDPIFIRKRFVYDIDNEPVEYNIGYYRADSFTYSITATR